MITIDQLLESVDLNFEPKWVTKDKSGLITIWADKPSKDLASNAWLEQTKFVVLLFIKLSEFADKPWTECIYEVQRKTIGEIEKLETTEKQKENKMEEKFTISKLKEYISAIKTMGFDEESSEIRISDGIINIDDKKNNKSATIGKQILSITIYDTVINEKGEQNV